MIWTLAFWKGAGERAVKTACQTALALIGTSALITDVSWVAVGSGTALAVLASLLTSVGNADFTAGSVQAVAATTGQVAVTA